MGGRLQEAGSSGPGQQQVGVAGNADGMGSLQWAKGPEPIRSCALGAAVLHGASPSSPPLTMSVTRSCGAALAPLTCVGDHRLTKVAKTSKLIEAKS